MNKAKILLTAVGMFAIIGGALAIKASRSGLILYYRTNTLTTPTNTAACKTVAATTLDNAQPVTTATLVNYSKGFFTTSICTGPTTTAFVTIPE